MSLHVQINAVDFTDETYVSVNFSCWDSDGSDQVSFIDNINIPHACFLAEKAHSNLRDGDAYEQFVMYLYDTDPTEIEIGKQFDSE